ncbi:MAG: hypothetical protein GXO65_06535 [Euryarchaeota archaeon]|nr:hypothetical protein [Euryarchaeota archaeon]
MEKQKRFKNIHEKFSVIMDVFGPGEKLTAGEIARRIRMRGYYIKDSNLRPFIYHRMLHKYLVKEQTHGRNLYSPV